jgi:hypothetical protein
MKPRRVLASSLTGVGLVVIAVLGGSGVAFNSGWPVRYPDREWLWGLATAALVGVAGLYYRRLTDRTLRRLERAEKELDRTAQVTLEGVKMILEAVRATNRLLGELVHRNARIERRMTTYDQRTSDREP